MITLTPRALTELKDLMTSQNQADAALRVWVAGGGCSGLSYGMALDAEKPDDADQIFEQDGVKILVDSLSLGYMTGASVDWSRFCVHVSAMRTERPVLRLDLPAGYSSA